MLQIKTAIAWASLYSTIWQFLMSRQILAGKRSSVGLLTFIWTRSTWQSRPLSPPQPQPTSGKSETTNSLLPRVPPLALSQLPCWGAGTAHQKPATATFPASSPLLVDATHANPLRTGPVVHAAVERCCRDHDSRSPPARTCCGHSPWGKRTPKNKNL